jgi:hypothetical protein
MVALSIIDRLAARKNGWQLGIGGAVKSLPISH